MRKYVALLKHSDGRTEYIAFRSNHRANSKANIKDALMEIHHNTEFGIYQGLEILGSHLVR